MPRRGAGAALAGRAPACFFPAGIAKISPSPAFLPGGRETSSPGGPLFTGALRIFVEHPMHIPARLILIVFAMSWVTLVAIWVRL